MKVILGLKNGVVELIKKPKEVSIEVRDYTIWEETENIKKDDIGEYYEIIL